VRARLIIVFTQYSVPIDHRARAVASADFKKFDYILASDAAVRVSIYETHSVRLRRSPQNLSNLKNVAPGDSTAKIVLFGSFSDNKPIADPYYGGIVSAVCVSWRKA
jgi:low molecular weight phosphotyrosine protein phosphatase